MKFLKAVVVSMILGVFAPAVMANEGPQLVVEQASEKMLDMLKHESSLYESDPDTFYRHLDELLSPVVAFDVISKGVMSAKYNRKASPEQMAQFEEAFKQSLVSFYGKALNTFDSKSFDVDITVKPVSPANLKKKRVPVVVNIKTAGGTVVPVTYTMFKNKQGQWLMRNVIVNGINIGKLFRSQFDQAMQANKKDLQYVIDHWSEIMSPANDKEAAA